MKYNSLLLISICLLPFGLVAYGQASKSSSLGKTLKVAVYDSPPFGFTYDDGTYGGLMVEIWEVIAQELGWE
jgi:ABC-type amino acid transport substrate-binding protein